MIQIQRDTKWKHCRYPLLLTGFTIVLLLLAAPDGYQFGSNTDWLSQHVSIADHFRKTFYETGNLLPDYSTLGGGSNMYMFAYYGLLRPDVLISYLLPQVPMRTIIIAYSVLCMLASVNLCYFWLKNQEIEPFFSFLGSYFLACSACFFQTHRQIMFVSYLPYLFLALMALDALVRKRKCAGLVVCLFLIYLHNFFFSIACLAVCALYLWHRKADKRHWLQFFLAVCLSIALAAVLLIPAGLAILENAKDSGNAPSFLILLVNPILSTLLYDPYGCGLTLICLYTLFLSMRRPESKKLAVAVFLCLFVNLISYLLNGTLYVRSKILIPFLPLILLLCVQTLQGIHRQTVTHRLRLALLCLLPVAILLWMDFDWLLVLDAAALFIFLACTGKPHRKWRYGVLCLIPPLLFVQTSREDDFVVEDDTRQTIFSQEELEAFYTDSNARFDTLSNPLTNVNYLPLGNVKKSTMYSSTMNTHYAQFYYDIMKSPISINNRVALLADSNPFLEYLMGVRYIQSTNKEIPYGYEVRTKNDTHVLAENEHVLPIAYGSTNLLSEEKFDALSFPYTLDTITNNTIVSQPVNNPYASQIEEELLDYTVEKMDSTMQVQPHSDGSYDLQVTQNSTLKLRLYEPLHNQILILSFDVESADGKSVSISINRIKNKLSSQTAAYPNQNTNFTYFVSSNEDVDTLNISLGKGHYKISNVHTYRMDATKIENPDIVPLAFQDTDGNEVLKGSLTMEKDGYFVTSLPYQRGYTAFVDGEKVEIEMVNKAFVGFPLKQGAHSITLSFTPPGKNIGGCISLGAIAAFGFLIWKERKKNHG